MIRSLGTGPSAVIPGDYTIDQLPDPAENIDKYARVIDLFGGKRDLVLASQDAYGAYWQPVRPVYKGILNITQNETLLPLKHASVLTLTGTIALGITRQLTMSKIKAFPGATFLVRNKLSNMLGSLQVLSDVGALLSAVALNNSYQYIYDPVNGWEAY